MAAEIGSEVESPPLIPERNPARLLRAQANHKVVVPVGGPNNGEISPATVGSSFHTRAGAQGQPRGIKRLAHKAFERWGDMVNRVRRFYNRGRHGRNVH